MKLSCPEFNNNEFIPKKFTCEGQDLSPKLLIDDIPDNTVSLALIVDDPDAPPKVWEHWTVWNILPTPVIDEGKIPGIEGKNDFGKVSWGGPCPPPGPVHRYFFKLYALDGMLDLDQNCGKTELEEAMKGSIIEKCELIGLYQR